MATSTPMAVNWLMTVASEVETSPTMKWHWKPTPSMGTPAALSDLTKFSRAVAFAPVDSML